jgi:HSP20 family protein
MGCIGQQDTDATEVSYMALIRWEPVRELQTFQQEVNRLFGTVFDSQAGAPAQAGLARRWTPAVDLVEDDEHYVLTADLPGVAEQDVDVEVEDRILTISGERRSEHEARKDGYRRVERASGRFVRTLRLPRGVDADGIDARFDNGVLDVRIPKPERRKSHKVAIAVGKGEPALEGSGGAS